MNNKAKDHFESARDMMDNLRSVRGANYARAVEAALVTMKLRDVFSMCSDSVPEQHADTIKLIVGKMLAQLIALASINGGLDTESAESAKELMGWAEKIYNAEHDGAEAALKGE